MSAEHYIPEGYDRIKVVHDLYSFLATDFEPKANVVLFQRRIEGAFDDLAEKMAAYFDLQDEEIFIKYSEKDKLLEFQETIAGNEALNDALEIILNDMECLYSARIKTHMRILKNYKIHSETYKFHVDGLEQDFDRFMTCYNEPVTQFIKNEDVLRVEGHDAYCKEDATIYTFKVGDIWKSRVRNKPKNKADMLMDKITRVKENRAFVHRAQASDKPRLLVVGDKRIH